MVYSLLCPRLPIAIIHHLCVTPRLWMSIEKMWKTSGICDFYLL